MVLEYLPTFAPKITQFCRCLYSSTMEHLGMLALINLYNLSLPVSQVAKSKVRSRGVSFFLPVIFVTPVVVMILHCQSEMDRN